MNSSDKKTEIKKEVKVAKKVKKLNQAKIIRKIYIGPSFTLNGKMVNHGNTYIFKDEESAKKFIKDIGVELLEKAFVEPKDIRKKISNSLKNGTKENIISNSIIKKVKELKENKGGAI